MKFKKIALIQGGLSSERDVSLETGRAFAQVFEELNISYKILEADQSLLHKLTNFSFDVAAIALHGKYGEDGIIQSLCEFIGLPYTGPGILSSAICMDKIFAKQLCEKNVIPHIPFQQIDSVQSLKMEPPFVVKPSRSGSSLGVSICKDWECVEEAFQKAREQDSKVYVEKYIQGRELTVSILKGEILTPIEVSPKKGFYDYKNKYTKGCTNYLLPSSLDSQIQKKCCEISLKIWNLFEIRGFCRVDFIISPEGIPYFMEVNTLPGLTPLSLLPQSAAYDGIEFKNLVCQILEVAALDYE